MEDVEAALREAELDRLRSEKRRIDSETEKILLEKEELSSKINGKWWHISGTSLIQASLGGAVAGFLVAGFALDHFINVTELNEKNEVALRQEAADLDAHAKELTKKNEEQGRIQIALEKQNEEQEEKQRQLQDIIRNLENESEQLQARVNEKVETPVLPSNEDSYVTDVWAYGVSEGEVNGARTYLQSQGYGVGSGGLLSAKPAWLANSPTVFYYHENAQMTAEKIAADLHDETSFEFDVRRGAGYGVARDEKDRTFFIHMVPMN